mmetsp:Transcript_18639/g.53181  ORF Transcript_18639/g.53181 Transcript_18639/m.53181 type:complete len:98 (-) Transcript_18639:104-397(-)
MKRVHADEQLTLQSCHSPSQAPPMEARKQRHGMDVCMDELSYAILGSTTTSDALGEIRESRTLKTKQLRLVCPEKDRPMNNVGTEPSWPLFNVLDNG